MEVIGLNNLEDAIGLIKKVEDIIYKILDKEGISSYNIDIKFYEGQIFVYETSSDGHEDLLYIFYNEDFCREGFLESNYNLRKCF